MEVLLLYEYLSRPLDLRLSQHSKCSGGERVAHEGPYELLRRLPTPVSFKLSESVQSIPARLSNVTLTFFIEINDVGEFT